MNTEMYPTTSRIRFEFPAREGMPAVTLHWSDGGNKPPTEVTAGAEALMSKVSNSGCLMVGEKGVIFSPDDGDQNLRTFIQMKGDAEMTGTQKSDACKAIPETIVRNAFQGAPDQRQHLEWIQAVSYTHLDVYKRQA